MTLVSQIITDALRESNIIAIGTSPTTSEMTEGLARLQAIVSSVLGTDVGYNMEDWKLVSATSIFNPSGGSLTTSQASAYHVKPQSRLICALTADTTVNLDPMPQDGQRFSVVDVLGNFATNTLTVNGNGRKIDGSTTAVLATNGTVKEYFYRADLGEWVEIAALATSDQMPFPSDFDDYFIIKLAMRLNPRFGRPLPGEAAQRFLEQRQAIIDRYVQERNRGAGQMKLASQTNFTSGGE
jgi:hypothetical protein